MESLMILRVDLTPDGPFVRLKQIQTPFLQIARKLLAPVVGRPHPIQRIMLHGHVNMLPLEEGQTYNDITSGCVYAA